jgi:PKD repeat protein
MKRFGFSFRSKKTALIVAATVAVLGLGTIGYNKVFAGPIRDCSANSIDYKNLNGGCGATSPKEFIKDVQDNNPNDLKAIYSDFGLVSSDYSKFVSTARMGMAYKNGTIVVDGQTVATNAWSIGRDHFSYSVPYKINGKTYYKSADTKVLLSNIPVMVLFNSKGEMQFAVMTACGNPAKGKNVTPKYSCDLLNKTAVKGMANTYDFSTKASASQNAKIDKVVYDFGDGSQPVSETSLSKTVRHTYTVAGTFTAKVTVYVSLPGKQNVKVNSANCETKITVTLPKPFEQCVDLSGNEVDKTNHTYKFTATTKQGNGATLKDANFDFGDGNSISGVKPASNNTVVTDHSYSAPGTYTVTATVNFNTSSGVQSDNCMTKITIKKPPVPFQQCVALNSSITDEQLRQVQFTATTDQGNGSVLKSADFNFGDGNSVSGVAPSSANSVITNHTYDAAGTYNVSATVHFNTPGGEQNENCTTSVTFSPVPAPTCDGLSLTKLGGREIQAVVSYTADGATLQSVTYNFGDGTKPVTVASTTTNYTYATDGTYSVSAAITFLVNGQTEVISSNSCVQTVSFSAPTCTAPNGQTYPAGSEQCKPTCTAVNGQTYPEGSEQCKTCTAPNGEIFPLGSSQCTPAPATLVNTGPGSMLGIFASTTIVGMIGYRWYMVRRLYRN